MVYRTFNLRSRSIMRNSETSFHIADNLDLPMRPQKRLKVLGMRMCGLISMRTFFSVWM